MFAVPLMSNDAFAGGAAWAGTSRKLLTFAAGDKELQLPYALDSAEVGGTKYNRLVVTFFVAPKKTGRSKCPPLRWSPRWRSAGQISSAVPRARCSARSMSPTRSRSSHRLETGLPTELRGRGRRPVRDRRAHEPLGGPARRAGRARHPGQERPAASTPSRARQARRRWRPAEGQIHRARGTPDRRARRRRQDQDTQGHRTGHRPDHRGPGDRVLVLRSDQEHLPDGPPEPIALARSRAAAPGRADDVVAACPKRPTAAAAEDPTALVNADLALSSIGQADARPIGGLLRSAPDRRTA